MDLNSIIAEEIDIYDLLGIPVACSEDLLKVSPSQVRKAYRQQALRYHPDKNRNDPGAIHKFHTLSFAAKILCDAHLRKAYDSWFQQQIISNKERGKHREDLIKKLHLEEKKANGKQTSLPQDFFAIEQSGQYLRKLKHFKKSYGNWKDLSIEEEKQKHKLYESSTLRLVVANHQIFHDKSALIDLLSKALAVELYDLYYSSRNEYQKDSEIVVYAVFKIPQVALDILNCWETDSFKTHDDIIMPYIKDISPKVATSIFKFSKRVDLEPHIREGLVNEETTMC